MGGSTIYDLGRSEREVLLYYLNKMRAAVVRTSEGLTDEQQRAPGVPSGTNLLGLVKHLTGVEEHWFQRVFLVGGGPDHVVGIDTAGDLAAPIFELPRAVVGLRRTDPDARAKLVEFLLDHREVMSYTP